MGDENVHNPIRPELCKPGATHDRADRCEAPTRISRSFGEARYHHLKKKNDCPPEKIQPSPLPTTSAASMMNADTHGEGAGALAQEMGLRRKMRFANIVAMLFCSVTPKTAAAHRVATAVTAPIFGSSGFIFSRRAIAQRSPIFGGNLLGSSPAPSVRNTPSQSPIDTSCPNTSSR